MNGYITDNGVPKLIRTDNATCFKSDEFKSFCSRERIKRVRSTPNLHTGTGLVERTIRTIKDLIRTNTQDGLCFNESLNEAIKTMRMTPNTKLKITPFELHMGRTPRTIITNTLNQENCLLLNWKKVITKYVSAHPKELQVYTIKGNDGGLVDYLVIKDGKRRNKSVSSSFTPYQFYERLNKPNSLKQKFKTDKELTAVSETKHTVMTDTGRRLHKKLISKPIAFQPTKKEDSRRGTNPRCDKCGRYFEGERCLAKHKSDIMPIMPLEQDNRTDAEMGLGSSKMNLTIADTPAEPRREEEPEQQQLAGETFPSIGIERLDTPVETPIKLSTQKTIRINRRNFRSPAESIIPTGTVDISEGELTPEKTKNQLETKSAEEGEKNTDKIANEGGIQEKTMETPEEMEEDRSLQEYSKQGNRTRIDERLNDISSQSNLRTSSRLKNAKRVIKFGGIHYV